MLIERFRVMQNLPSICSSDVSTFLLAGTGSKFIRNLQAYMLKVLKKKDTLTSVGFHKHKKPDV